MALHHAASCEIINLRQAAQDADHARTAAIVKTERFEAIRLVLAAGEGIPTHQLASEVTLQCLEGAVQLKLPTREIDLQEGQWLFLEANTAHAIEAVADAALLMTVMLPVEPSG